MYITSNFARKQSNSGKILLSIIIPCFNSENYIEKCINSILKQRFRNYEILIYDDGSTDNSIERIQKIKSSNVHLYFDGKNLGQGKRRNQLIKKAKGKYITFLDSDDYYFNDLFFYEIIKIMRCNKYDVIITPYTREKEGKLVRDKIIFGEFSGFEAGQHYISRNFGTHAPGAKIYRKDVIKNIKFSENGFSQDVTFVFNSLLSSKKVLSLDIHGYIYRNDNVSCWRPAEITKRHVYSSLRLVVEVFYDILAEYSSKKNVINTDEFIQIYRKEHLPRIKKFIEKKEGKETLYELLYLFNDFFYWINFIFFDFEIYRDYFKKNKDQSNIKKISNNDQNYVTKKISDIKFLLEKIYDENFKNTIKDIIVIYLSHLHGGGLERVAILLGKTLSDKYNIIYILDDIDKISYNHCGYVYKADIFDPQILYILRKAIYIFDFKYKDIRREHPFLLYILNNYAYKYISTVHNTKTFYNYVDKIYEYIGSLAKIFKIICVSKAVRESLESKYDKLSNISVLYNPIDIHEIRECPSIKSNRKFILFSGRLSATEQKGIDIAIEAYARTKCKNEVDLYFCGDGEMEQSILDRIKYLDIYSNIKIMGYKKNIFSYMKSAEFVFAPSRWEGFSMTLIESLACGTPVLTTKVGGAEEVIVNGKNGYFINDINNFDDISNIIDNIINKKKKDVYYCINSVGKFDILQYKKKVLKILK